MTLWERVQRGLVAFLVSCAIFSGGGLLLWAVVTLFSTGHALWGFAVAILAISAGFGLIAAVDP